MWERLTAHVFFHLPSCWGYSSWLDDAFCRRERQQSADIDLGTRCWQKPLVAVKPMRTWRHEKNFKTYVFRIDLECGETTPVDIASKYLTVRDGLQKRATWDAIFLNHEKYVRCSNSRMIAQPSRDLQGPKRKTTCCPAGCVGLWKLQIIQSAVWQFSSLFIWDINLGLTYLRVGRFGMFAKFAWWWSPMLSQYNTRLQKLQSSTAAQTLHTL